MPALSNYTRQLELHTYLLQTPTLINLTGKPSYTQACNLPPLVPPVFPSLFILYTLARLDFCSLIQEMGPRISYLLKVYTLPLNNS